jgi:uncharacterized caspase-like protein
MTAWAFVIGINDYPAETGLNSLKGAVADAAEFADWVLHPNGGAVAPANLFLWTFPAPVAHSPVVAQYMANPTPWPMVNPDFGCAPTALEINQGVNLVARQAKAAGANRLYVFFAGHGFQTKEVGYADPPQTCFVAGNFDPEMMAAGLVPCDDMARMLKAQGPPEIVLFLDACRSDASLRVARPLPPWNVVNDPGHNLRVCVGRAAQEQRVAYEVPHGSPNRGAFTTLLVNGLRTHRVGNRLTLKELDSFVSEGIAALVSPYEQYPDFDERPKPWQLVLANGPPIAALPNLVISLPAGMAESVFLVGGPDNRRRDLGAAPGQLVIALEPGAYVVETAGGAELTAFAHVGPGDTHVRL